MNRVLLYSRPGCHLCDEIKTLIEQVRDTVAFQFEVLDIEQDAKWFAAYQYAIPVVTVNDVEVARYRISESDFRRAVTRL